MKNKLFILFILLPFIAFSQRAFNEKNNDVVGGKNNKETLEAYKKSIDKEQNQEVLKDLYFKIAEIYQQVDDYSSAIYWYEKALSAENTNPKLYMDYADVLLMSGDYAKAKDFYVKYLSMNPVDKIAKHKLDVCSFGLKHESDKPVYLIENLKDLNSDYSESGVAFFKRELSFSSARLINGSTVDNTMLQGFSDVYYSNFDSNRFVWSLPKAFDGYINTRYHETSFTYSSNDNIGYFTRCNSGSRKKNSCSLFMSKYDEMKRIWDNPIRLAIEGDSVSMRYPSVSKDGNILYFSANMPGGYGGYDLYRIKKIGANQWSKPENLGPKINTVGNEVYPFIVSDTMLVFSSDGFIGFGNLDLYYSKIIRGEFESPVNMLSPFNSSADDFGLILDKKNFEDGFFISNRKGGVGFDDIYRFSLIPVEIKIEGVVLSQNNQKPISNAHILIKGLNGFEQSVNSDKNGAFTALGLTPNANYTIRVEKDGYFADSRELITASEKYSKTYNKLNGVNLDFDLLELTKEEIKIKNISFDSNSALTDASKLELKKLGYLLKASPNMKIVINSYTDEAGDDIFNQQLSEKRALSVMTFLASEGVGVSSMSIKGWGRSATNTVEKQGLSLKSDLTFRIVNINQFKTLADVVGVEYRLQFAVSKSRLSKDEISVVQKKMSNQPVTFEKDADGFIRYFIGSFKTYEQAIISQNELFNQGVDAFIVAFNDGNKISIKEVLKNLNK